MIQPQRHPGWCGVASVVNALRLGYGRRVSQQRVADIAGIDETGHLDEMAIISVLDELGYDAVELWLRERPCRTLQRQLALVGSPVILVVDDYEHWVVAFATLGDRFMLADSSNEPYSAHTGGLLAVRSSRLRRRWGASKRMREGLEAWYGIAVYQR